MKYSTCALLCLPFLLTAVGDARAEDAVETWDRMHIAGSHAGYVHTVTRTSEKDGQRIITTVAESVIEIVRMGASTKMQSRTETTETAEGKLLRIESTSLTSGQETRSIFTFSEGKVTIETTVMGNTRTVTKEVPADLVGPRALERVTAGLAGTCDQVASGRTFMADFQSAVLMTMTSKGQESVKRYDGTTAELTRVNSVMEGIPLAPVAWLSAEGEAVQSLLMAGGMRIETFRVPTEAAAKSADPKTSEPKADVFEATLLQEADPIPAPRRLEAVTLVVRPKTPGQPLPEIPSEGHTATAQEDGSWLVVGVRRVPAAGAGVRPLVDPAPELLDDLAPSSMIQSDAELIQKVAREVVGTEPDAWKAAQRLERWVYDHVGQKNMSVAFASALETCQSGEGDCTEHALLLAALCRAAGIPARVLMGLEFIYGVWGGHAWNEVYVGGEWFPLDATNGLGYADPLHLPLARMTMKEGAQSEMVQLLGGLGTVDIDIVEVVRDGRKIRVQDAPKLVVHEDGAYVDRIWGLSFKVPEGYELEMRKRGNGLSPRLVEMEGTTSAGRGVDIEIDALDAPAGEEWTEFLAQLKVPASEAVERTVDGRSARQMTQTRNGRQRTRVAIMADGALYLITMDNTDGEAEREVLDKLLTSMDFDVK